MFQKKDGSSKKKNDAFFNFKIKDFWTPQNVQRALFFLLVDDWVADFVVWGHLSHKPTNVNYNFSARMVLEQGVRDICYLQ